MKSTTVFLFTQLNNHFNHFNRLVEYQRCRIFSYVVFLLCPADPPQWAHSQSMGEQLVHFTVAPSQPALWSRKQSVILSNQQWLNRAVPLHWIGHLIVSMMSGSHCHWWKIFHWVFCASPHKSGETLLYLLSAPGLLTNTSFQHEHGKLLCFASAFISRHTNTVWFVE